MDDAFHAERLEDRLDADRLAVRAHERHTCSRVRLRPRHGGRRVVKHANSDVVSVVDRVRDARQAACEEGRVANERELLLVGLYDGEPLCHGDSRAHTEARVDRIKRFRIAERVAADVTAKHSVGFPQRALHRVETAPVGTSGAQHRRTNRQGLVERGRGLISFLNSIADTEERSKAGNRVVDVVLAAIARVARQLAIHLIGCMSTARAHSELVFDHMIELFENDDAVQAVSELIGSCGGEGVRRPHLPKPISRHLHATLFAQRFQAVECLTRVCRRNAARNNTELGIIACRPTLLLQVEARKQLFFRIVLRNADKALVDFPVTLKGASGEDDPPRAALEALFGNRLGVRLVRYLEKRRGMADSRRRTNDNGRLIFLGKVERRLHHGEALLGRGRVEHGNLRKRPEAAGVLLGLRGDGARIVGDEEHAAALDSHVVQAHQGVGSHVQADLLAGEQRARAAVRRASEKLESRLFVRRPLHMHAMGLARSMQPRDGFHQFGRRRPRVSRDDPHTRFKRGMGERFVAHQQFLRHSPA